MDRYKLKKELIRDESIEFFPYKDSEGILTIGIGHNLEAHGITQEVADLLYEGDIANVLQELNENAPWWQTLSPLRQRVIANMAFNLGLPKLLKFKRMIANIEAKDFEGAADEMLDSKWADQVGPRAYRLANMMRSGEDL